MTGLLAVCRNELNRIVTLPPVFAVMILAVAIYAVLYPQPYLNEALRKSPVIVVDQDRTTTSRELIRRVDATPDVAVVSVEPSLPEARRHIFSREASGILVIPEGLERELLRGRASPVALYADASYFLIYQRIALGITAVTRTMGAETEIRRLIGMGVDRPLAAAAADPMPLTAIPLFNPQGGYASYLLPAAFVLILQQTLLIGIGLLGTLPGARPADETAFASPLATVAGKLLAYLALQAVTVPFLLVVLPWFYGIPRLGSLGSILLFALPFGLAVGSLGLVIAGLFRSALAVQLTMASIGMPFFFLSGFSWPLEAMPRFAQWLSLPIPSTAGIDGFVRLGQLGAGLSDLRWQMVTLWALAGIYTAMAVLLERRRATRAAPAAATGLSTSAPAP